MPATSLLRRPSNFPLESPDPAAHGLELLVVMGRQRRVTLHLELPNLRLYLRLVYPHDLMVGVRLFAHGVSEDSEPDLVPADLDTVVSSEPS